MLEDGEIVERLRWADLEQVGVVTTTAGPWNEDMFWVLSPAADGGVVAIPHGDAVHGVVPRLLQLPGFDNHRLAGALGSTSQSTFAMWHREHESDR